LDTGGTARPGLAIRGSSLEELIWISLPKTMPEANEPTFEFSRV